METLPEPHENAGLTDEQVDALAYVGRVYEGAAAEADRMAEEWAAERALADRAHAKAVAEANKAWVDRKRTAWIGAMSTATAAWDATKHAAWLKVWSEEPARGLPPPV